MRDRPPKMLVFPDLGLQVEVSQNKTERLQRSVEQHNVSGKGRSVNSFYGSLRTLGVNSSEVELGVACGFVVGVGVAPAESRFLASLGMTGVGVGWRELGWDGE